MTIEQEHEALYAWLAACDAWQAELDRVYKSKAGDARYNHKLNAATPELAKLKAAFHQAMHVHHDIQMERKGAR
jgi:hypothetical protein